MFDIAVCRQGIRTIPGTIYIVKGPSQTPFSTIGPRRRDCFLFRSRRGPQPFRDGTPPCDNSRWMPPRGVTEAAASKGRFASDTLNSTLPTARFCCACVEPPETTPGGHPGPFRPTGAPPRRNQRGPTYSLAQFRGRLSCGLWSCGVWTGQVSRPGRTNVRRTDRSNRSELVFHPRDPNHRRPAGQLQRICR